MPSLCPVCLLRSSETKEVVYTDVDGRYVLQVPPGTHQIKVALEGYQEKVITVEAADRPVTLDVGLTMTRFAETVEVTGQAHQRGDLVGRSAAHRAQTGAGHYRQHRLAGDEGQRRSETRRQPWSG